MSITRGPIKTGKGPADRFIGDVYVETVAVPTGPSSLGAALVRFAPGAHTAWHKHPLGQMLFVLEGEGLVQRRGGPVEVIRPGDRVWTEPNEEHWHGATASSFMAHMALQQYDAEGVAAHWGEHVTDAEYSAAPGG
jgi:quercetin dioxygenase-like cupin family protein